MAITINGSGTVTGVSVGGLPDGIVDNDTIANTTIAEGKLAAGVNTIQEYDNWMVNADFSAGSGYVTSNWERMDQVGFNKIGTGMTQSSGVFTFPSTGIWNIQFGMTYYLGGSAARYVGGHIYVSTNGSGGTFYESATTYTNNYDQSGSNAYGSTIANYTLDVTNTTNCVCKFHTAASETVTYVGHTTRNCTYATFLRVGDT